MKNLWNKLKSLIFKPKMTTQDYEDLFYHAHKEWVETGVVPFQQLEVAIGGLKREGYSLAKILDMEKEAKRREAEDAKPEKKYSKGEGKDDNVITLH